MLQERQKKKKYNLCFDLDRADIGFRIVAMIIAHISITVYSYVATPKEV